ncbi:hypothetical protein K461DRAFT_266816 [Myriangium duriaei CBS 260.36]|uniref:Uncharacterized protein n=1 Tax=Myriangium duriaei CBS 260.36 TaxID=1168546 RepID=A0A9P4MNG2_9PEZI|nr:hypothetical protein K461DRAFT_266816 [Myriangium duriaei CBS 260.36]
MRVSALIPVFFSLLALILTFLCLFAGSKTTVLAGYPIITLNTSELFQNSLNTTIAKSSPKTAALINGLPVPDVAGGYDTVSRKLGLHDFYTINILNFCEGYFSPGPAPNATLKAGDIHKQFSGCTSTKALYDFNFEQILQAEINQAGHTDINLTKLQFPNAVQTGLNAFHKAQEAVFILYCFGIGFTFILFGLSLVGVFLSGRISAFINVLFASLAFVSLAFASAVVTVLAAKGSSLINKFGKDIGLAASSGGKLLALTWVATVALIVCASVWCFDCIVGRRASRQTRHEEKAGSTSS